MRRGRCLTNPCGNSSLLSLFKRGLDVYPKVLFSISSPTQGQAAGEFQGGCVLPVSPRCPDRWVGVSLTVYKTPTRQVRPDRVLNCTHLQTLRALLKRARFPQGAQPPLPSWGARLHCAFLTDPRPEGWTHSRSPNYTYAT